MNIMLFIVLIFALQLVCLYIGSRVSKGIKDNTDYFLAGRTVTLFPLTMTLVATQIGGGIILGSAEEAFNVGWNVFFYPLGACLGMLLLAAGIGRRMSEFKVSTVAQLFEVVYGAPWLKKIASLLSIISLFMILIAQVIASKKFVLSLGIEQDWIFLGFWALMMIYTVMGGMRAVIATDIVQALFFIIVFSVAALYCFYYKPESVVEFFQGESATFNWEQIPFSSWMLMPLLFMVIEQDMGMRCFSAKSGRIVTWASAISAVCILFVCFIPIYFGTLARDLDIDVANGSSIFMSAVQATTNPIISAFVGCAVIAAIISTADALLNAISSNLVEDFNIRFGKKKSGLEASKFLTFGIGVVAVVVSYFFTNIVDMLVLSYELSVCCLFVPVFWAMFRPKGDALPAALSVFLGMAGFFTFRYYPIAVPKELASIGISLLGYVLGMLYLARKTSDRELVKG